MSGFRGSDQQLDREIESLERIARTRTRRAASELRELDQELHELRRERGRRRATLVAPTEVASPSESLA